ncbi:amidohydrolase family protein [Streptomyces sp. NPDC004629]|uniref:amidohydrolase family protein n=1 Tax=Streptomyces sp. NPDC004629 TaxID=3364705 RepID=UPI0036862743
MTGLSPAPAPAPSSDETRTKIFTGPRILAGDGTEPEALAVRSGWIVATGTRHDLRSAFPTAEEVALDGALVVPGFNDAHCHPSQAALARVRVDLNTLPDTGAVLTALRRQAQRTPPRSTGPWPTAPAWPPWATGAPQTPHQAVSSVRIPADAWTGTSSNVLGWTPDYPAPEPRRSHRTERPAHNRPR